MYHYLFPTIVVKTYRRKDIKEKVEFEIWEQQKYVENFCTQGFEPTT